MAYYAGLDVSLEQTSVCVVDEAGQWSWSVGSRPSRTRSPPRLAALPERAGAAAAGDRRADALAVARAQRARAWWCIASTPAGPRRSWRCGRHKTDRNDARGLAEIARMGWYANVRVKSLEASCAARQARGARRAGRDRPRSRQPAARLLAGLRAGPRQGQGSAFEHRVLALVADCPALEPVADALLAARRALLAEVERLDRGCCARRAARRHLPTADDRFAGSERRRGVGAEREGRRRDHRACLHKHDRGRRAGFGGRRGRRLCRAGAQTPSVGRGRPLRADLEAGRRALARLSVRSRDRADSPPTTPVCAAGLGPRTRRADRDEEGPGRARAQARGAAAPVSGHARRISAGRRHGGRPSAHPTRRPCRGRGRPRSRKSWGR